MTHTNAILSSLLNVETRTHQRSVTPIAGGGSFSILGGIDRPNLGSLRTKWRINREWVREHNLPDPIHTVKSQIFVWYLFSYFRTFGKSAKLNPLSTGQSKIGRRRPISLDYHCVNISQQIFINKISLERSFHYLNADTLLLKIGQEMTTLQTFEVTQLIDFALHRSTSVTCGRDFAHSITMVTWNV